MQPKSTILFVIFGDFIHHKKNGTWHLVEESLSTNCFTSSWNNLRFNKSGNIWKISKLQEKRAWCPVSPGKINAWHWLSINAKTDIKILWLYVTLLDLLLFLKIFCTGLSVEVNANLCIFEGFAITMTQPTYEKLRNLSVLCKHHLTRWV